MIWLRRVWLILTIPVILFLFLLEFTLQGPRAWGNIKGDAKYWLDAFADRKRPVKLREPLPRNVRRLHQKKPKKLF